MIHPSSRVGYSQPLKRMISLCIQRQGMDSFQNIAKFFLFLFFFFHEEQCIEFWEKMCFVHGLYMYIYACLNIHILSLEKNKNLLKFILA